MLKKQTSQSGSTAGIITTLILAILLAGTLGYTWWQNSSTIKPHTSAQPTNQKETTPAKDTTSDASNDKNYLVIKEWGVKLKTPIADHLTYQPRSLANTGSPTPYDELGLKIKSTSVTNQNCVDFGADLLRQKTPSDRFETKKIGDYYYFIAGAPGLCSEEPSDKQLQQEALIDLNLSNLEKI